MADLLSSLGSWLTGGFGQSGNAGQAGGLAGLLGGVTGSTNPLVDALSLISLINQGQLSQEQLGFLNNVINQQTSAMNTAMNPAALSAFRMANAPPAISANQFAGWQQQLTPPPAMTATQFGQTANQLTNALSPALTYATLNPVNAQLASRGQALSPTTAQYVSQQALAPFQIQEQQMGMQGAQDILNQLMQEQQMGFSGAQDLLQQHAWRQQMGQDATQFGLSLPFSARPSYSTNMGAGFGGTPDLTSLLNMLNPSGGTTFDTSGFGGGASLGNTAGNTANLLLNQFLPGVFP